MPHQTEVAELGRGVHQAVDVQVPPEAVDAFVDGGVEAADGPGDGGLRRPDIGTAAVSASSSASCGSGSADGRSANTRAPSGSPPKAGQ